MIVVHALVAGEHTGHIADFGDLAGVLVQSAQHAVGSQNEELTVCIAGQGCDLTTQLHDHGDLAGGQVHLAQAAGHIAALGDGVHGAGGVVEGHVTDIEADLGGEDLLDDHAAGVDADDAVLVAVGLAAVGHGIDGAVIVGSGVDGVIVVALHGQLGGVGAVDPEPGIAADAAVGEHEAVHIHIGVDDLHTGIQSLEDIAIGVQHLGGQGGLAHSQAGDGAVGVHRGHSGIGDGVADAVAGVPGLHIDAGLDTAGDGDHQILAHGSAVDGDLGQSGLVRGDLQQTHVHGHAGGGGDGAAQLTHEDGIGGQGDLVVAAPLVIDVDVLQLGSQPVELTLLIGPEDAVVMLGPDHGAEAGAAQAGHGSGGIALWEVHPAIKRQLEAVEPEVVGGIQVHEVEPALPVDGHAAQRRAVHAFQTGHHLTQLAGVQVHLVQSEGGDAVEGHRVHIAVGVVEGHADDGRCVASALEHLAAHGGGIKTVEGACAVKGIDEAVHIGSGQEAVDAGGGIGNHRSILGLVHIQLQPCIGGTQVGAEVEDVQLALQIHNGDLAGGSQTINAGGDVGGAARDCGDNTAADGGNAGIIAGPGHGLGVQLCIIRQGLAAQAAAAADLQGHALGGEQQIGHIGLVGNQIAAVVIGLEQTGHLAAVLQHADVGQSAGGLVHLKQTVLAVKALVGGPVELVGLMIDGHGLLVQGHIAGGTHEGSLGGGLVDGVQVAVHGVDGIQDAVIVAGQGQSLMIVGQAGNLAHIGGFAGEPVHGQQVSTGVGTQDQGLIGQDIEGIGGIVKGHIQSGELGVLHVVIADLVAAGIELEHDLRLQLADVGAVPLTQPGGVDGVVCIDADDVLIHVLGGVGVGLALGEHGGMHQHGAGILEGRPAVVGLGQVDVAVAAGNGAEQAVAVETVLVIVLLAAERDLVVGLVGAVVAQGQLEHAVVVGNIQNDGGGLAVHAGDLGGDGDVLVGCAALGQRNHRSQIVVVGHGEADHTGVGLLTVEEVQTVGIQHDVGGDDLIGHVIAVIQVRADLKLHPIHIFNSIAAVPVPEIIDGADLGVHQRGDDTVGGEEIVLGGVLVRGVEELIALGVQPGEVHQLGTAEHAQIDLHDLVGIAVAVGRQDIVGGIVILQDVGVQTQVEGIGAVVGEQDVHIAVGDGVGIIVPGVIDCGSGAPVAVEAQEGQAQIDAIRSLGIGTDEAVHIDAVSVVLVHVGLVRLAQGDGDIDLGGAVCGHLHHIQGGEAGINQLVKSLNIVGVDGAVGGQIETVLDIAQAVDRIQEGLDIGDVGDAVGVVVILLLQAALGGGEGHLGIQTT